MQAWVLTEPLGNPASTRVQDVAALFDAAFRPDYIVRKSIIGFHHDYIRDTAAALEAGFGSLYWMEGVVVRLQVRLSGFRCSPRVSVQCPRNVVRLQVRRQGLGAAPGFRCSARRVMTMLPCT